MSWNPQPTIGIASWAGNAQLVTKPQLFSTTQGLINDINDLQISSISKVSTITATEWMSTPVLYVSDLKGATIDLSGGTMNTNIVLVSSIAMKGFDNLLDLDVSFDFGLGQAIGGLVGGLGALVGGGLIGAGTGVGLAIQGAETGIASMIAPRGDNYINNTTFETINFTTQLQFSTLGGPDAFYSSILRTVSTSGQPNTVPGSTMFVSTIFPAGTACVRSISDPFNLISGNSNLNTSTIQAFGQWCPLEGLEPEFIFAQSVSTNLLSTGQLFAFLGTVETLDSYSLAASNLGVAQSAFMNYQAPLQFQTGATNNAAFVGDLNRLYCYNTTGWIFSGDTHVEMASLYVGCNANESILNVSSIYSMGEMKTVNFYASSITAETLNVVSTIFITSTSFENITSTQTINADLILGTKNKFGDIFSTMTFSTPLGYISTTTLFGDFDIRRSTFLMSTSYNAVSSLTQNIIDYSLTIGVQDEAVINIYNGQSQLALYSVTPQNVGQWGSTILLFDTYEVPGQIDLGSIAQWGVSPGASPACPDGATFDVIYTFYNSYANSFLITQEGTGSFVSTFYSYTGPSGFTGLSTFRFTLPPIVGGARSGWWTMETPSPPPYETINSNSFQIYQDVNDTYIKSSDRLHLVAGDIYFEGNTVLSNVDIANFNASNINATFFSSVSTAAFGTDTYFNTNIWVDNAVVGNSGDFSSITTIWGEPNPQWQAQWMSNYTPSSCLSSFITTLSTSLIQSLFMPEVNRPTIGVNLGATDDMTLTKLGLWLFNGVPQAANYALGTFLLNPTAFGNRIFTDNNGFGLASNLQVVNLSNISPTVTTNLYIGFPGPATPIPPNSGLSVYWNNATNLWTAGAYTPWDPLTGITEVDITQGYNWLQIASPSTILNSNVTIGGTLSLTGKTMTMFQMTWNHDITTATQHGFGAVQVQDGNGNLYNASQWRMVHTVYECYLNSPAYAMNSWEVSPAVDGNGNYILNYSLWFTSPMAITFQMYFWVDIVMYPREMIEAQPPKNWGNI